MKARGLSAPGMFRSGPSVPSFCADFAQVKWARTYLLLLYSLSFSLFLKIVLIGTNFALRYGR
jgi:hypothetical protein